jgi:hypothetical protein
LHPLIKKIVFDMGSKERKQRTRGNEDVKRTTLLA